MQLSLLLSLVTSLVLSGVHAAAQPAPDSSLPDAPSASAAQPVHLPRNYRPEWSVQRSRLGDKLRYGAGSLVSVRNLAEAFLVTGIPNLPQAPPQPEAPSVVTIDSATIYGDQMDTYGHEMDVWRRHSEDIMRFHEHRLETGLATAETRQLLSNMALPILLHQDARYRPAPIDASFAQRMGNAAKSIVFAHSDSGRLAPNYSRLGGTVAAGFLGRSLYSSTFDAPELKTSRFMIDYVGLSLAGDLATNVAHEMLRAATEQDVEVYNLHGRSTEDSYYPMSAGAKIVYWGRSTYASRNFLEAILLAGLPSIGNQPVEPPSAQINTDAEALAYDRVFVAYGNAIQAWRRQLENGLRYHDHRLIGGFAASETQMTLQNLAIPMLLGIDPRYIPLGRDHDASARFGHAFRGLVEARTDSGGRTVNLPVLVGTAGGALLAKQFYYPQLGTPALGTNQILAATIGFNLALDLVGNIRSEFSRRRSY
jgi:hypothetical protein